jgi:hypothetical protein
MAEVKKRHGYPQRFRAAYAKNSNDAVMRIARVLNESGMCKGITLSFQSMDEETLKNVKRKNIKVQSFEELIREYRKLRIPTYSEIIIGLPGETYESFKKGLGTLIEAGQHDSLQVYTCELLPNSEMSDPEYRKRFEIESVPSPMPFFHATNIEDPNFESYEIVVKTSTLSREDWLRTQVFAWAVQCFHCLSLTQYLAVFLKNEFSLAYEDFYEELIDYARRNPESSIGIQLKHAERIFKGVLQGGHWFMADEKFGEVNWPPEEGSFLFLIENKPLLYQTIGLFFRELLKTRGFEIEHDLVDDVLLYQERMVIDPFSESEFTFKLKYNLHSYFSSVYVGESKKPTRQNVLVSTMSSSSFKGDLAKYAREVIWYGRKGGEFRYSNVKETSTDSA